MYSLPEERPGPCSGFCDSSPSGRLGSPQRPDGEHGYPAGWAVPVIVIAFTSVPWRKPRREVLLLVLVAVTALAPIYRVNPQDTTRTCGSEAIAHGQVRNDLCFFRGDDFSTRGGHNYSDKAPGLAIVEVPAVVSLGLPDKLHADARLWALRLLVVGSAFVACAFLIGRLSEGLVPGFGAVSLVTFAVGTLMAHSPLRASTPSPPRFSGSRCSCWHGDAGRCSPGSSAAPGSSSSTRSAPSSRCSRSTWH